MKLILLRLKLLQLRLTLLHFVNFSICFRHYNEENARVFMKKKRADDFYTNTVTAKAVRMPRC